ncbi:hypothetical protein [Streptomyces sp. MN13]
MNASVSLWQARDIVQVGPPITERVRERLLEALERSITAWTWEEFMRVAWSVGAQMLRPLQSIASAPLAA